MKNPLINHLDTLEIAKELEAAGISKEHAEAQTRVYVKTIHLAIEQKLATKEDIANLQ